MLNGKSQVTDKSDGNRTLAFDNPPSPGVLRESSPNCIEASMTAWLPELSMFYRRGWPCARFQFDCPSDKEISGQFHNQSDKKQGSCPPDCQNSLLRRRNGVLGRHRACREGLSQDETSASEPKCTLSFNAKRSRLPLTLASSLISGLTFALSTGSSKGRRPSCINHVTQFCLMSGRDLVAPGTEIKSAPDVEPVYRQTVITVCLPEGRANHSEGFCWFLSKGEISDTGDLHTGRTGVWLTTDDW
ncbi:hypothetical protein RRG08_007491 [Elysia crispata]|uniref:Uncharacterized protein n=1 Tax=Elysia crispata TaxID=231223 RepID=A0AAE1DFN2_9GAST|nr:hypothetical protein RRG08_007491 [Elysia crispata]